jgi:hypothetical protein
VYASGGSLALATSTLSDNQAAGGAGGVGGNAGVGFGEGGHVGRGGTGGAGGAAQGGGLYASEGTLTFTDVTLTANKLTGGRGGDGGSGLVESSSAGSVLAFGAAPGGAGGAVAGGGLFASGGLVHLTDSTVSANLISGGRGGDGSVGANRPGQFRGGPGGAGGAAAGGGLHALNTTLTLSGCTVAQNRAAGGHGGSGGTGGSHNTSSSRGAAGGAGGIGGESQGGGLYASGSSLTLTNVTDSSNRVRGGTGGRGGNGGSVGSSSSALAGRGGNGGNGGLAEGGGLFLNSGTLDMTNVTVAANQAKDSTGGVAGLSGSGGKHNHHGTPGAGQAGQGGGVQNAGGTVNATNSLIALNTAATAPDFSGDFATALNNLLGDGTGSNLAPANPDANGNIVGSAVSPIDPMLGPLAHNGGPTRTQALLAGSPAIDAGTTSGAPATDQRGAVRDTHPDIGAFEFSPMAARIPAGNPVMRGTSGGDTISIEPVAGVLLGGRGAGTLQGGPEADILVGGQTDHSPGTAAVFSALEAVLAEWARTDVDY